MKIGFITLLVLLVLIVFIKVCSYSEEAANLSQKEFGAKALLKKYEWFKDAASQLDRKIADIAVYQNRIDSLKYDIGKDRTKWDRTDKEQLSIWMSEVAGVKSSYNDLASQYNSQMSKFNYAFANVGKLPKGATVPLPKEFKPYIEK